MWPTSASAVLSIFKSCLVCSGLESASQYPLASIATHAREMCVEREGNMGYERVGQHSDGLVAQLEMDAVAISIVLEHLLDHMRSVLLQRKGTQLGDVHAA